MSTSTLQRAIAGDLAARHPADAARVLEELTAAQAAAALAAWKPEVAARVLAAMSPHLAVGALALRPAADVAAMLARMERASAALLLRRSAEASRGAVLDALGHIDNELRTSLMTRLRFPDDSAGGQADADMLCLPATLTVAEAMRRVRAAPRLAHHSVLALADDGRIVGVFNLRDLFAARPRARLEDIMTREVLRLPASASLRDIVEHPAWRFVSSLPVVDDEQRPVGALRWRKARAIEHHLRGITSGDAGSAARALGDLFVTGLAGAVDALTLAPREVAAGGSASGGGVATSVPSPSSTTRKAP